MAIAMVEIQKRAVFLNHSSVGSPLLVRILGDVSIAYITQNPS
jgi:hypothetical protein